MICHFLILSLCLIIVQGDWTSQCNICKCTWSDGRKKADCRNASLNFIPDDLSSELRLVDFSANDLFSLRTFEFSNANLKDVHKLKLRNCKIQKIDAYAFASLALLTELDLSENQISELAQETFKDNLKLQKLFLNYNNLILLEGEIFHNLKGLQTFEISYNKIIQLDPNFLDNGLSLKHVDLSYNRLKHIDPQLLTNLKNVHSIHLESNPWVCDCRLRKVRDLIANSSANTAPIECHEPPRLRNKYWRQIDSNDFACAPKILEVSLNQVEDIKVQSNFTVFCKVSSDPDPEVSWIIDGHIIEQSSVRKKYQLTQAASNNSFWSNLTIFKADLGDKGDYHCIAKNAAGQDERTINVLVGRDLFNDKSVYGVSMSSIFSLAIGLSIAVILLIILVAILTFYCIRNNRKSKSKMNSLSPTNDYINLPVRQEIEKSLITEINPVTKPPRQYSTPLIGGSMELDIKTNLLDNDMNSGIDDESQSFDFEQPIHCKSQNFNNTHGNQLPPDLLSFPHRSIQVSPTTSSVSMIPDQMNPQQYYGLQPNIQNPTYDSLCRTLPYSRSQSPFISPLNTTLATPCPRGYVTIPRRPRTSWSSELSGHSIPAYPLYDNLGSRTTAAGSSSTHLNEAVGGINNDRSLSRVMLRPLPKQSNASLAATLPRSRLSTKAPISNHQVEMSDNNKELSLPSNESDLMLQSVTPAKVPPRPPPKPKKRSSAGPLFEDEGEDGTEI